ncbi:SGNH/GDSL hydrolase family protein [Oceanihabitans sp. 2_MG-2023]|uniref:SGNH/GDSL hydrolase family protein n=1 Tax=Oceanihabitans sp. 2_MG-2023 TaxID=3062661 RepID=UPI0026E13231|nr:SGNH/GDSL hydrolase family protein [Oceanihabitans sp. 2_MG-2023]MDO6596424.1 SGNH/GDSL hydrolase family protein [Oceanihabitans sp. 2_MG-2023]
MKQIKFKILSILIGISLSFLMGELIARVYFFGGAAFSYSRTNSFGILDNSGLLKYSNSDQLKYELLPNLDTKYKLVDFKTNAEGFRDRDHELNANTTKIAVLGDSFTMGTGVKEQETYVYQTERTLNNSNKNENYEVFNFGVSGYALSNYITILKRNTLNYNPDLVVIGFCASNDHFEIGTDFSLEDFTIKPKKNVFWDSYIKKLLQIKLKATATEPVSYNTANINYIDKQFKTLQNILSQNNSKGLIFYLDLVYDPIRVATIKKLSEKNNLLFLDVSEFFQNKNLFKYIVNELDPHPNGKANQIFAEKLSSYILANSNM